MLSVKITVDRRIDVQWSEWLGEIQGVHTGKESIIRGTVVDQAALFGLISKTRDLGLSLRSVNTREKS